MSEGPGGVGHGEVPEGGGPACWLDRVCPECGRFLDEGEVHACPVEPSDATGR